MWSGEECVLTPVYSGIGHRKIELGFHPVDHLNFHENMMSIKKHTYQWVLKEESFLSNKAILVVSILWSLFILVR
jgi:hypothetical protein